MVIHDIEFEGFKNRFTADLGLKYLIVHKISRHRYSLDIWDEGTDKTKNYKNLSYQQLTDIIGKIKGA